MNHRIILMVSGLLMMFSVYGFIMMIGAYVGEDDAYIGNGIMALIFTALTLIALQVGLSKRKKARVLINDTISKELERPRLRGCHQVFGGGWNLAR